MQESVLNKINYGYFIDEDGLYFYSEKDGKTDEVFSINGVASVSLNFTETQIQYISKN